MDSQARRRERRAAKQTEWKAANPLLVGVSAKPQRQVLTLNRKVDRVQKAAEPIRNEMATQIIKAADVHEALRNQSDKRNQRMWHNKPTREIGITCSGRQKMKGKSIPLI
ncbi:36-mer N-terminal peptide of the N protein (N36) [Cedecea lapagei]|uniref:36-mer N-terminal peptide of the N protein (N36) n=1 Tax=Cedecea lapagei TaxID=158823 RepID=A0A447V1W1_9ENTR|nr:antitermination protein N [Cedecea lapagei]VEB97368.1 36-mer N-terminal peptide of the N protein (N36) [Cedecea lapagei]